MSLQKKLFTPLLCIFCLTSSGNLFADENMPTKKSPPTFNFWTQIFHSVEDFRNRISSRYYNFAIATDEYFSGKKIENTTNKSHLKLELKTTFLKGGEIRDEVNLRVFPCLRSIGNYRWKFFSHHGVRS